MSKPRPLQPWEYRPTFPTRTLIALIVGTVVFWSGVIYLLTH